MIGSLKNKVRSFRDDPHMREVGLGMLLAFGLKVVGAVLAFSFNVAVARLLGAEGAGLYFLALSFTTIGALIGRVGLDNTLLRFVAIHAARGEWGAMKGAHKVGINLALVVSSATSITGFILAPWLAEVLFQKPELSESLRWMSLAIVPLAMLNLKAESLKGLKRVRDSMLIQGLGVPLFGLLLIFPFVNIAGQEGAAWVYLCAVTIVAALGFFQWRREEGLYEAEAEKYSLAAIWASCHPLWATSLMNRGVLQWAPLFMLGVWASSEDVGVYGAAMRAAMLVSFMLFAINNILGAKFAELYALGDMQALGQTARRSALLVTLLASPIFLIFIVGGKWIMAIFGPEFVSGWRVLAVLTVGQFISTLAGSVNLILNVTGNEHILRNITFLSAIALILACVILIPLYGLIGAAIATAAATVFVNLAAAYAVWAKCGIRTVPIWGGRL